MGHGRQGIQKHNDFILSALHHVSFLHYSICQTKKKLPPVSPKLDVEFGELVFSGSHAGVITPVLYVLGAPEVQKEHHQTPKDATECQEVNFAPSRCQKYRWGQQLYGGSFPMTFVQSCSSSILIFEHESRGEIASFHAVLNSMQPCQRTGF